MISLIHELDSKSEWQRLLYLRENLWYLLTIKGYWTDRVVLDEIALRAAEQIGDRTLRPWVLVHTLSWRAFKHGKLELSAEYCNKGLKLYEDLKNDDEIAFCKVRLGLIALANREMEQAAQLLKDALDHATFAKNDDLRLWSLGVLGDLYCALEDFKQGRNYLFSGLELAEQLGWPVRIGLLLNKIGYSFLMENKLDEARTHFDECLDTLKRSEGSHVDIYARAKLGLAMVLFKRGALKEARVHFKDGSKLISGLQITEEYLNVILEELTIRFTVT
jgi:tetratricopeptide (TPR) repeat protein